MRVALIDHSYHKTTKSTEFFSELLARIGSVHRFYDESWCRGENLWRREFAEADYDLIIIWQAHEAFAALSGRHDNVLFVPMYDAMLWGNKFYWKKTFATAKCLSFSHKLHQEITRRDGTSRYFKYFPDPVRFPTISDFDAIRAFFWYRMKKIEPKLVFDLCRDVEIEKFTLHNAPDPEQALPKIARPPSNIAQFEVTTWFDSAEHYRETLLQHNLFFAPRPSEGIGMSFLEAMACGLCVVAPNAPTMNEYITDGTNGLLYAMERRFPLDVSRIKEIGARARETVERGYAEWQKQTAELIDFIATPKSRLPSGRSAKAWSKGLLPFF